MSFSRQARLILFIWALLLLPPAPCLGLQPKQILNLNSYHSGFEWSEGIVEGISSELGENVDLYVEYMDTKRFYSHAYNQLLRDIYNHKYANNGIDLVIASDDNAFQFILQYRDELFPQLPVVFCGVNDYHPEMIRGEKSITGVIESIDHREIIELALELSPDAGEIHIITDRTTSGMAHIEQIREIERNMPDVDFIYTDKPYAKTAAELVDYMETIPKGAVVYYSHFFKDASGEYVDHKELVPMLTKASAAPIFVNSPLYIGYGPVGGYVVSPFFQGKTAAELAGQILAGSEAGDIPIIEKSPNRYVFDYRQLVKYGIDPDLLPEESKIINKPTGFYERNKAAIVSVAFVIIALTVIIVLLVLAIIRKRNAEKTLLEAKRASEAASRTKSEFLANMSHEIRTPLNGILGMLQLMQTTGLSDEQKEYVLTAIQSSNRLTRLLSDILDISRVEVGKIAIQSDAFDPGETLCQIIELFEPASKQGSVQLQCIVDEKLPRVVKGDEARLHQVLNNLVGNAFKFTDSGSITVSASPLPETRPGRIMVLFSVADTGIGIPDDKLDHLFEPFTQASEGFRRRYQGAGLGLAICKRLIELMGGSISVESNPGEGTTFYFTVEFEKSDERQLPPRKTAAIAKPDVRLDTLLAEDDEVSATLMKRLLEKSGCSVTLAGNGKQALDALRNNGFDLVFMDVQMPIMDGVEATRAIREGRAGVERTEVPIIALTAYAMSGDKEKFLEAGMNDYLAKPVAMDELTKILREYEKD